MEELLKNYIKKRIKPAVFDINKYNSITVKKLAAGCYNLNYLAKINSKKFVFRMNAHSDAFEGNNLENEYKILSKLNGFHSPKVFLLDKRFRHPFIIEEFIEGREISRLSNLIVKKIAKSLAEIHSSEISGRKRGPVSLKNEYLSVFDKRLKILRKNRQMHEVMSAYVEKAKRYLEDNEEIFRKYSKRALLHGDTHCKNIFLRDNDIIFIDWEGSEFNDPAFDIVAFFYESENLQHFNEKESISEEHKKIFLKEYLKINRDKHLKEKIRIIYPLRWIADTLWLACRIVDYKKLPEDSREKLKARYLKSYKFNLNKLQQMW
jgi:thiamine kinase-like enzyme